MSEREGAGKPQIHLLNDWLVVGDRVYGSTEGRYINALLVGHTGIAKSGQHLAGENGVTFILGKTLGVVD